MSILKKGIDVSKHQGAIDWAKVKASGVDFAIIRAGYGKLISQKDKYFETNYASAKAAGIPIGCYWYSYALTEADAAEEAKVFLEAVKGKNFEYPVYFDIEDPTQKGLGKSTIDAICKKFLSTVEAAGYWVGLYSYKSFLEGNVSNDIRTRYAVWVAHYDVAKTTYDGQYGMWQYSSKGAINGISGNVDVNECYYDYPTQIKSKGLNGFTKAVTAATTVTPTVVTHTVVKGDTLWAIAKKYGTTVAKIVAANKAKYSKITANYIQTGWTLKITK